jgi:hypothetical protein
MNCWVENWWNLWSRWAAIVGNFEGIWWSFDCRRWKFCELPKKPSRLLGRFLSFSSRSPPVFTRSWTSWPPQTVTLSLNPLTKAHKNLKNLSLRTETNGEGRRSNDADNSTRLQEFRGQSLQKRLSLAPMLVIHMNHVFILYLHHQNFVVSQKMFKNVISVWKMFSFSKRGERARKRGKKNECLLNYHDFFLF